MINYKKQLAVFWFFLAIIAPLQAENVDSAILEHNKERVLDFFRIVFEAQNVDAVKDFIVEDYIQHSPHLENGREPLVNLLKRIWPQPKPVETRLRNPPVVLVAEGDIVIAVFKKALPEPTDPTKTYDSYTFETIRLKEGMFVEHWDSGRKRPAP